jgi:TolA-binding protein
MNDPKRLLDDPGSAADAEALLRALRPAEPPSPEKQAELVRRMMTLSVAPPLTAGIGVKSWLAVGLVGLVCGLAAISLWWPAASAPPARRPSVSTAALDSSVAARELEQLPPPAASGRVLSVDARPAPVASVKTAPRDTLAEEEALLEQARRALATSPGGALRLLRQHQERFPAGQLTAERMFLSIEALRRAGDHAGAERQTQALLRRFPSSVYAGQLRNRPAQ